VTRRLPWFQFDVAEFLADTSALSANAVSLLIRGMALLWKEAPGKTHELNGEKLRLLARIDRRSFERAVRELDDSKYLAVSGSTSVSVTLSSRYLDELAKAREEEAQRKRVSRDRPDGVRPLSGAGPEQRREDERKEDRRTDTGPTRPRPKGPAGSPSNGKRWPRDYVPSGCSPIEPGRKPSSGAASFGREAGPFGGFVRVEAGSVEQFDFLDIDGIRTNIVFSSTEDELRSKVAPN
jgi:hypothetical protein